MSVLNTDWFSNRREMWEHNKGRAISGELELSKGMYTKVYDQDFVAAVIKSLRDRELELKELELKYSQMHSSFKKTAMLLGIDLPNSTNRILKYQGVA